MQAATRRSMFRPIGTAPTEKIRRYDGNDEFLLALRGQRGIQTFREMADNDPIIGGFLHVIFQSMRKVKWTAKSETSPETENFISSVFDDMTTTWPDALTEILTMLPYGWALIEQVYKFRKGSRSGIKSSKFNDNRIGLSMLALRDQSSRESWKISPEGVILGMTQASMAKRTFLPMGKCILYRAIVQRGNPEGRSILRTAYRPWFFKKQIEELMVIGVERDLVGLPMMAAPEGFDPDSNENHREIYNDVTQILRNVRNDEQGGIITPFGWNFSLLGSPGDKQFDLEALLNYYDKRIAITVMGQFMLLGMERVGSFALAKEATDLFTMSMAGWINSIADTTNRHIIDPLLKINNLSDGFLVPGRVRDVNLETISLFLDRLIRADAIKPDDDLEEFLRRLGGLTEVPDRTSRVQVSPGRTRLTSRATGSFRMKGGFICEESPEMGEPVAHKFIGSFVSFRQDDGKVLKQAQQIKDILISDDDKSPCVMYAQVLEFDGSSFLVEVFQKSILRRNLEDDSNWLDFLQNHVREKVEG